jgi:hypothetical protein
MTQYLVAIYRPEQYDPTVSEEGRNSAVACRASVEVRPFH